MTAYECTMLFPALGVLLLLAVGHRSFAAKINLACSIGSCIASFFLAAQVIHQGTLVFAHRQCLIDAFGVLMIVLTAFVFMTTAFFSQSYMTHNVESGRITRNSLRLYHVMFQLFAFMMLLVLSANNIGILWVAMEGSTLATVLLVSLYRTPEAVEAAWKYFILCIVGIALALLGTILVYASAENHLLQFRESAILWNVLYQHAHSLDASTIKLAFVFLLVGYGTKVGLVPLHYWLPDAHSESPAPMSTLLSGLLLNGALYALIRFKMVVDLSLNNHLAGYLMMGFGLLSFLVASILIHRQNNVKRMFSYSSIEHMGLITFAFGIGNSLATFCAVFYMLMHSLNKSAVFVTVGNVIQQTGTQSMDKIRGLMVGSPKVGWSLLVVSLAISGLPPFGIFTSELLLFIATIQSYPIFAIGLIVGFLIAFSGILRHIQPMVFGTPSDLHRVSSCLIPVWIHLALLFILGVYLPSPLKQLLNQATLLIGGGGA